MPTLIKEIKKAKKLRGEGRTTKEIELEIGISRNYIPKLLELYDEMTSGEFIQDKNSEYVRIKKKRYMMKSIKLQHRMADMRKVYIRRLAVLGNKRKVLEEYLDKQEAIVDIKKELFYKQEMLNVTSSNLQHAEDGYEYIKQEWNYSKAIWFMAGISFSIALVVVVSKFLAKVTLVWN